MTTNPMREQVIEAVAGAIWDMTQELGHDDHGGWVGLIKVPLDKTKPKTQENLKWLATAALTAVLDATAGPTREMVAAGINVEGPTATWRAMHAALRRKLTGGG